MKRLIEDLDSVPTVFTDGFRGVMLLLRNKDGEVGNAQRNSIKRISSNSEEWKESVLELHRIQQDSHQGHRIYSSVNSRDITKAIHEFKRRQLEIDFGNRHEYMQFYTDIKNRFFSCLMNPNARAQNHFIIDCDSQNEYVNAHLQLRPEDILMEYATKNGFHVITNPFNPNERGNMQIKKDDMMFIG